MMIRDQIRFDLQQAIKAAAGIDFPDVIVDRPIILEHGDYSTNVALVLAKQSQKNPRELAQQIIDNFPQNDYAQKIEIAGAGFINFFLDTSWIQNQIPDILKGSYGLDKNLISQNQKTKIQVEFISANPTGPLHTGNARGGFCGDTLANILQKVGYKVEREYYINDKGGQIDRLAQSVEARYKELQGDKSPFPEDCYQGDYIVDIAKKMLEQNRADFSEFALNEILDSIKKTIAKMGIKFDEYFSEQSLYDTNQDQSAIELLKKQNLTYEDGGAFWLKTSQFGDDKDRVLIKSDGEMTYFVSDIAYHLNKFDERKFDRAILFWGADHHGYIPRFMTMLKMIGHENQAEVRLVQLLKLEREGKEVRMSKRSGDYITVDEVLDEIGLDAARFHFLAIPLNTPMTLDLEKAKEQSVKNPVYYVQYAHARLSSILRKASESNINTHNFDSAKLDQPTELALIKKLTQMPEIIFDVSNNYEVHLLPRYSIEIADTFHRFYENCQVLTDDKELSESRLGLLRATQIVLAETLGLMGVCAPERM